MRLKIKKRNCFIALLILGLLLFEVINPFKLYSSYLIRKKSYTKSSSYKLLEYGLKEEILADEYNKFIDVNVSSKDFKNANYNIYREINYYDKLHDIGIVNDLISNNYTSKEINCLLNIGTIAEIKDLLKNEKYDNLVEFACYDYAKISNISRYIAYQKQNISNYRDAVLQVEIGLDHDFYTEYNIIDKFSYTMLVNKYNQLDSGYVPDNLVKVNSEYNNGEDNYGNEEMLKNFYQMADDLYKDINLHIYINSGYRDFRSQQEVMDEYLELYGSNYVKNYVAYPGFSEHQTGLAVDLKATSGKTFADTEESKWLKKNAYKYGFILRYSKQTEPITGYKNEEWHYRYVTKDVAAYIYNNNITLDEYSVMFKSK